MSEVSISLKGNYSHARKEVTIEQFDLKVQHSDNETEKLCDTTNQIVQSVNETSKFTARKNRLIEEVEKIKDRVEEKAKDLNYASNAIKQSVNDFKYESSQAQQALVALFNTIVDGCKLKDEDKEELKRNIKNIADQYCINTRNVTEATGFGIRRN